MKRAERFVADRRDRWSRLEELLKRPRLTDADDWSELASLYRSVCADLAAAQSRSLAPDVVRYLDELAAKAHNRLYGARVRFSFAIVRTIAAQFPAEVRRSWRFFLAANLVFYGPFIVGAIGGAWLSGFAESVLPEAMRVSMEQSYSETITRSFGQDASMAGFYVLNNVGIALRCFATGALAGLGTLFYLFHNGLVLGTTEGYLWRVGAGTNLLTFTAGHSPWELTGIVVAGTAGFRLGWALVVTEGRTRTASLRRAAPALYRLVLGAVVLLLVAALIEGFFSASAYAPGVKWGVGGLGVVIVALWLSFGGRGGEP